MRDIWYDEQANIFVDYVTDAELGWRPEDTARPPLTLTCDQVEYVYDRPEWEPETSTVAYYQYVPVDPDLPLMMRVCV
jgi:hypothetical protein